MIIIYYGNGKGKTTAALGVALRASGYGKKILFAQFIKSPKSLTGEDKALKKIPGLTHKKFGLGFVGLLKDSHSLDEHKKAAVVGFRYIEKNLNKFDLVVCDEILGAIRGGLIKVSEVKRLLSLLQSNQHIVLTGRPKYKGLIDLADLVTETKEIKHPFTKGKIAVQGIDY